MPSHRYSKNATTTGLTSAEQGTRRLIVYSDDDIRRLTGTFLWGNVLFALLALIVTENRTRFIGVATVLFAVQLVWSVVTIRHPEHQRRTFFLLVAYVTAIGSLAWLVMSTGVMPAHASVMLAIYVIGLVAAQVATPRLVDIEKGMGSKKQRRWYMWSAGSATVVGVAAVLGQIASSVLSRSFGNKIQWYFFGGIALAVALALAMVCFYNIEKFRRYPKFMSQVD